MVHNLFGLLCCKESLEAAMPERQKAWLQQLQKVCCVSLSELEPLKLSLRWAGSSSAQPAEWRLTPLASQRPA